MSRLNTLSVRSWKRHGHAPKKRVTDHTAAARFRRTYKPAPLPPLEQQWRDLGCSICYSEYAQAKGPLER